MRLATRVAEQNRRQCGECVSVGQEAFVAKVDLMPRIPSFASFWAGPPPSPYERACLSSFTRRGYRVTLYSFESYQDFPDGVRLGDASNIVSKADLDRFIFNGRPDLSHFSDYFRYSLFSKSDEIWIDTDLLLLKDFIPSPPAMLLAKEHAGSICGAIMRIDKTQIDLETVLERVRRLGGKQLRWGETGPKLLTSLYGRSPLFQNAYEPYVFYPILYDVFWRVYLPEERDSCAAACDRALTLHLWNNIVVQLGIWKNLAPPEGSYLHSLFAEIDALDMFEGTYPADVLRRMIDNYRLRETGGDISLGSLARQIVPSALRTARRKGWLAQTTVNASGRRP